MLSHFLLWGMYTTSGGPPFSHEFVGLQSTSGIFSILAINSGLLCNYIANLFFFFKLNGTEYNRRLHYIHSISLGLGLGVFLVSVIGIFWFWEIYQHFTEFFSGFYIWFFSALSSILIGFLFHYNNYKKLRNKTNKQKAVFISDCLSVILIPLWSVGLISLTQSTFPFDAHLLFGLIIVFLVIFISYYLFKRVLKPREE